MSLLALRASSRSLLMRRRKERVRTHSVSSSPWQSEFLPYVKGEPYSQSPLVLSGGTSISRIVAASIHVVPELWGLYIPIRG